MMSINTESVLNEVIDKMQDILKIRAADIPNIDLYMDQVTTFMDEKLRYTVRPGESGEKILTKTMINNYAKNDLLPPPYKKKYSREHMMILIIIYYFKGVLSFSDIQELLKPITDKYFDKREGFSLEDIYREVFEFEDSRKEELKADITGKIEDAKGMFADAPAEDEEFFTMFSLIVQLGYDVYLKRLMIEKIIDGYVAANTEKQPAKNKKKEPKSE